MNLSHASRFAPALAFVALALLPACGSGEAKTTFLVYGEGAGPGSYTLSGGLAISSPPGSCQGTSAGDIFGNTVTGGVVITCEASPTSPKIEITTSLPTFPIAVGTYDEPTERATTDALVLYASDDSGGGTAVTVHASF